MTKRGGVVVPNTPKAEAARAVRRAAHDDVVVLSHCLAAAFRNDPSHVWMFPDPERRTLRHPRFFAAYLKEQLTHAEILTTDRLEGAAIWEAPRAKPAPFSEQLGLGLRLLPILGLRFPLVAYAALEIAAQHPKQPHWYLAVLGTDPRHQGKGVGRDLMKPVFERCDTQGVPAYLEASREENVPYYQRHGFRLLGGIDLPRGPTIWRMIREPQPT